MPSSRLTKIDLNQAGEARLAQALKISPRLAQRIITMRPYNTPEDLKRVWGLDAATLETLIALLSEDAPEGEKSGLRHAEPAEAAGRLLEPPPKPVREPYRLSLGTVLILLAILLAGAYLRLSGLNWDQNTHQHPDERFMTIVAERIQPVLIGNYFDTANSTLNPFQNNAGYTYGMLPLFVTRAVAGWLDMTHYDKVVLVGRALSAGFDLAALFVLYVLGNMLFKRRVGLLAAGLYAVAVLPIQLSHYFAVDSFSTVFLLAGFIFAYQAVPLLPARAGPGRISWWGFGLFGLVTGLAMACKLNAIAFFGVIILAAAAYLITVWERKTERWANIRGLLIGLLITAGVAFVAFRITNPYTFMGPSFYGLKINERWYEVIKNVTNQVAGKSEWPPNHHWTSRGVTYAWTNIVSWGLGWPLGLAAWAGWLYAAWRCFKGEWRKLFLLVAWVGGYFIWQNMQFWRYMRYFILIYPMLVLFAAWGLVRLWDWAKQSRTDLLQVLKSRFAHRSGLKALFPGLLAVAALGAVVGYTTLYAIGFTDIYHKPITRVQASEWMLQNIRGPLNVVVDSAEGQQSYPIASPSRLTFSTGDSTQTSFVPLYSGTASSVTTVRVSLALADLRVNLFDDAEMKNKLGEGYSIVLWDRPDTELMVKLPSVKLEGGKTYYISYVFKTSGKAEAGGVVLRSAKDDAPQMAFDWTIAHSQAVSSKGTVEFVPPEEIQIDRLVFTTFNAVVDPAPVTIEVKLNADDVGEKVLTSSETTFMLYDRTRVQSPTFTFDPVQLDAGTTYYLRYTVKAGGPLVFEPEIYALETSWDDALPLSIRSYGLIGNIYAPLNLQLYEPDSVAKRETMLDILEHTDYLVLPSNRSYDSMPRLTLRYPLTLEYYQALFDCECSGDEMEALAAELEAPFHSPLGFDLVATFTHHPTVGWIERNDQLADESFTVYDHPKVMIFKKSADFSIDKVRALFESVDLTQVVFQAPLAVTKNPTGYVMPEDRAAAQLSGGTLSQMFDSESLLNTSQPLGTIVWYLTLFLLSLLFLPSVLTIFRKLPDRGYPLARIISLLAVGWAAWLLASLKLAAFTRVTILLVLVIFALVNVLLAVKRWSEFSGFIKANWRNLLAVEGLFAVVFVHGVLLRLGNPDLWQPWMGGEKPMNFAIFNSVLKSVYFPPANPWLSGYYLNYYYYGYVLEAIPTKLLGIMPSFAYNLILPTWFAMSGVGAFCVAYNLTVKLLTGHNGEGDTTGKPKFARLAWIAGLSAVVLMLFLGNLYQVRKLWEELPAVAPIEQAEDLTGASRLIAAISGAGQVINDLADLPGSKSSWYFEASRPILNGVDEGSETPIAEFPLFTYLYGDMHPHLLVMPIWFAALAWLLLFFVPNGERRPWLDRILFWAAGGLVLGVFRGAHTWDYVTLLGLAIVAAGWTSWLAYRQVNRQALMDFAIKIALLLALTVVMYFPVGQWFITGYTTVILWKGSRTPLGDYLIVHGLFLFILVSFLLVESGSWISGRTARLKANRFEIIIPDIRLWIRWAVYIGLAAVLAYFSYKVVPVLVLVIPLLFWVGLIFFKKGQSTFKQILLALFAAGLAITVLVEVVTLKGDAARMNTVFRFYMQVWTIFSVTSGAMLGYLFNRWHGWRPAWRWSWTIALALLVLGAAAYPLTAIPARYNDRWPKIFDPPVTLNGMDFMLGESANVKGERDPAAGAVYNDSEKLLHLGYDYDGIRFMQENVSGTPTIVEGIHGEYRWTGRYSVYTGLPAVASWSWHVRQHNSLMDGAIVDRRIEEVKTFYETTDLATALAFLERYQVEYVILGDMEREFYAPDGVEKFSQLVQQGNLEEVFSEQGDEGGVQIFKVVQTE